MIEKLKAEVAALRAQLIQNGISPQLTGPGKPPAEMPATEISPQLSADAAAVSESTTPSRFDELAEE